jgi:hypothetical protein
LQQFILRLRIAAGLSHLLNIQDDGAILIAQDKRGRSTSFDYDCLVASFLQKRDRWLSIDQLARDLQKVGL